MTSEVAEVYTAYWAPRTDAYADWTDTDGGHWYAVRRPLTPDITEAALLKKRRPISAYMEDSAGLTHVLAVDIDRDDGWDVGLRLVTTAIRDGCHLYPEHSRRGCHLWGIISEQVPGPMAHAALVYWMERADRKAAHDPKVEIMPKPVSRGPDTLGFALRLPMMPHQRTGQWNPLCGMNGQPLGKRVRDILLAVEDTPATVVRKAAGNGPLPRMKAPPPDLRWPLGPPVRDEAEASATELLATVWGVLNAHPGRAVKCPMHDDKHPSLSIADDDQRVFCKSPECEWYGNGRGVGSQQMKRQAEAIHG